MFPAPHHSVPGYVKPLLDLALGSEGPPGPLLSASDDRTRPCSGGLPRLGPTAARTASSLSRRRNPIGGRKAEWNDVKSADNIPVAPQGSGQSQWGAPSRLAFPLFRGSKGGGGSLYARCGPLLPSDPFGAMDLLEPPKERPKGWYLSLMAPNRKGPAFAWLDPSRLYCNSQALADCVEDVVRPFRHDAVDLVAGIDAMGFILGGAIASTLGKGFLAIRKAGHLCVSGRRETYSDYTGREKTMEVRDDAIKPGVRVLLVDQWIETGGTMTAAIRLLERMGATIVGVAAVAVENSEGGKWIKENYKCSHCVPEELQGQIDGKYLDSFRSFETRDAHFSA
ncbi:adenine phosphoribosyltransferase isoform X2 [Syngnathoides biaculeatus]|uniref:adenine phosphoribosyltransferase isoform X2 n=1 Tax=Syngnathoides biaculeatus TaxID=300417 RepID=UPI002ADE231C|nr:adenine phosphoribosyltransferase isoform X2 [Syngnathoides biaculeatus]